MGRVVALSARWRVVVLLLLPGCQTRQPETASAQPQQIVQEPIPPQDPILDAPPSGHALGLVYTALAREAPMRFVGLSGGEATLGCEGRDGDCALWESPRRRARPGSFALAESEVTRAQWLAVLGPDGPLVALDGNPQRPVGAVMWCDAVLFANSLSLREGLQPAYAGVEGCGQGDVRLLAGADGFRLPTEDEWEYAARAGSTTRFWSGDRCEDLLRVAWIDKNSGESHPVAEKPANPWGFFDVHGNVWEWVWAGPQGDSGGTRRVVRGGGHWQGSVRGARSASRRLLLEGARGWDWCRDYGLRLARSWDASHQEPSL